MQHDTIQHDIAIIGGGLVGAGLACALNGSGGVQAGNSTSCA